MGEVTIDVVNDEFFVRSCYKFEEFESNGNGTTLMQYYHPNRVVYNPNDPVEMTSQWHSITFVSSEEVLQISEGNNEPIPAPGMVWTMAALIVVSVFFRKRR